MMMQSQVRLAASLFIASPVLARAQYPRARLWWSSVLEPAFPGDGGQADEAPGGRGERAGDTGLVDRVVLELRPEGQHPERVGVDPGADRERHRDRARNVGDDARCGGGQAAEHDQ